MGNGCETIYDVIVTGGGPGGAVAAQRCAQNGFKTVLVEKKKLPREKVCSGMIMGPWANTIIRDQFGEIPQQILTDPHCLAGHLIHVLGAPTQTVKCSTPIGWRKDIDFWMLQRAADSGVDIQDGTRVTGIDQQGRRCKVILKRRGKPFSLKARYVVAADGGASTVRKSLFPNLKVRYSAPVRECYRGSVEMERDYIHWFFPEARPRPRFDLLHKDQYLIIEGSGIRVLREVICKVLADHGFDPGQKPVWRDGCLMPLLHEELVSGAFAPAKGNVLLAGDAAGVVFPITFEGIGSALKSGVLAADSIVAAAAHGNWAADEYLVKLKPLLEVIRNLLDRQNALKIISQRGATPLAKALKDAYESTLEEV